MNDCTCGLSIVPRSKSGKKRAKICPLAVTEAIIEVRNGMSIRKASTKHNVPKSTIHKYLKLNNEVDLNKKTIITLKNDVKKVFEEDEEVLLLQYLEKAAYLHMALDTVQARKVAYQFAVSKGKKIPEKWREGEIAGIGWLKGFRKRHLEFSLRKPEATSLARATSFNKTNVAAFFQNLKKVICDYNFAPEAIYNLDETGISTVHKPAKVLAPKSIRQLGKLTSAERGANITMIACINAIGNSVPPLLIFPRVNFKNHMLKGAPPGAIGAAHLSGWSTEPIFRKFLDHFIQHAKPSKQNPVLLIMDNHESHISVDIIDKAIENGIVLLTLHPHTSHRMQPLDRTVFGPFKRQYNKAADQWMVNNPGKPISIYEVAELVGQAYPLSFTPKNITKGFKITGICPFDEYIFSDDEFLSSYVTDRPEETSFVENILDRSSDADKENKITQNQIEMPNSATDQQNISTLVNPSTSISEIQTLEDICPFPKALPRKVIKQRRKRGKTRILTATPEKNEIVQETLKKTANKRRAEERKKKIPELKLKISNTTLMLDSQVPSTSKIPDKKINVKKNVVLVMCTACRRYEDKSKVLVCNLCQGYYHFKCISKSHKEYYSDSDDENSFICQKCFVITEETDVASEGSAAELFETICHAK